MQGKYTKIYLGWEHGKGQSNGDYVVIKAMGDGVNVTGLTRGFNPQFHHSEKHDESEVMIAQFTEYTSAIKIRGKAKIFTSYGELESEK